MNDNMNDWLSSLFSSDEYRMILGEKNEVGRGCMLLSFYEKVENAYHFSVVVDSEYYRRKHNLSWKARYTYRNIINRTANNSQARSELLFDYHQQFEEMRLGKNDTAPGGNDNNVFKQILSFFVTIARAVCDSSDN